MAKCDAAIGSLTNHGLLFCCDWSRMYINILWFIVKAYHNPLLIRLKIDLLVGHIGWQLFTVTSGYITELAGTVSSITPAIRHTSVLHRFIQSMD